MSFTSESSTGVICVAIDVAKQTPEVLIEPPGGARQRWRMVNVIGITPRCNSGCRPLKRPS